jgi:hypothetical protein
MEKQNGVRVTFLKNLRGQTTKKILEADQRISMLSGLTPKVRRLYAARG